MAKVVKKATKKTTKLVPVQPVENVKAVKGQVHGFMLFIREQGVVGLSVGLVLGTAVKSVVDSIVNNIVNPVIGFITGGVNLSDKKSCLQETIVNNVPTCVNELKYGQVLNNFISLLIVAAIIYFVVRGLKLDRFDVKKA